MSERLERLKVRIIDTGRECYDRSYDQFSMLDVHSMGYRVWEGEIIGTDADPILHHLSDKNVFMVAMKSEPETIPVDIINSRLKEELTEGVGAYARRMLEDRSAVVITHKQWVDNRFTTTDFVREVLSESGKL